jgi:predicted dehydrogenase
MPLTRRSFLGAALAAPALGALATRADDAKPARKIKIGFIGCGGRGFWIAKLFQRHGGYAIHALADYFPAVAATTGQALGVDEARRFTGLSGYQKLIASGIEAIVIIDVPYFYPEQAQAAVAAGLHVYMAKPVAVDVPGALAIGLSGQAATQQQRVFLVDYQMPTDPLNIEVYKHIAAGGLGKLQTIFSTGAAGGNVFNDPPLTQNLESRLRGLIWVNDDALGCGYIGNYDIHVVDAVLRATGRMPVAAYGWGARFRNAPHGDALDSTCVMFTFEDGMVWNHQSPHGTTDDWFSGNGSLAATLQGSDADARLSYWGKAFVRGGAQHYGGGKVENLYEAGAVRNIASFYEAVTKGDTSNPTVQRAVDSVLTCILGREAAARRTQLTMAEIVKENKKLTVDLTGLKT